MWLQSSLVGGACGWRLFAQRLYTPDLVAKRSVSCDSSLALGGDDECWMERRQWQPPPSLRPASAAGRGKDSAHHNGHSDAAEMAATE
jgi:hypothetical protein